MKVNRDGNSPADGRREPASGKSGELADETPSLDPRVQDQLGRVFRNYCEDLVHQPIPDKLAVLLARLEAKQREKE